MRETMQKMRIQGKDREVDVSVFPMRRRGGLRVPAQRPKRISDCSVAFPSGADHALS